MADEQVYVEGVGWEAAEAACDAPGRSDAEDSPMEPTSTPARPRRHASATLPLPDEGGGFAYKRTVVAELNKLRPCQHRLSTDRVVKVRQAAKMMADSRERPTAATRRTEGGGSKDAGERRDPRAHTPHTTAYSCTSRVECRI